MPTGCARQQQAHGLQTLRPLPRCLQTLARLRIKPTDLCLCRHQDACHWRVRRSKAPPSASLLAFSSRSLAEKAPPGALQPRLYVHIAGDSTLEMPLCLPDAPEEKARYFFALGRQLHGRGLQPCEAVAVPESWIVNIQQAPAAMNFPTSQHPARQEAIVLIGRNTEGNRYSQVVQPLTRDKAKQPVWQPLMIANDHEPWASGHGAVGLLDYFIDAMSMKQG